MKQEAVKIDKAIFDGFDNYIILLHLYSKIWRQTFKDKEYISIIELKINGREVELSKIVKKRKIFSFFYKRNILKYKGSIIGEKIIFDKEYIKREWKYMNAEDIIVCGYEIGKNKKIILKIELY